MSEPINGSFGKDEGFIRRGAQHQPTVRSFHWSARPQPRYGLEHRVIFPSLLLGRFEDTAVALEMFHWLRGDHNALVPFLFFLQATEVAPFFLLSTQPLGIKLHSSANEQATGFWVGDGHEQTHAFLRGRACCKGLDVGEKMLVKFLSFFGGKERAFPSCKGASEGKSALDGEAFHFRQPPHIARGQG